MTKQPDVTLIKSELFKRGGLEKYTWQLAKNFCALGHRVTVLTTGHPLAPFEDPLLQVVSLPVRHALSVIHILHFDWACDQYLKKYPTPIIFSLDRNRFQTHIRAGNGVHAANLEYRARMEGRLRTLSFFLNPLHRSILTLEKQAFEHPGLKTLFTNSEMVRKQVLHHYNTDPRKVQVVHNGVEWYQMQQAFNSWELQKETKSYGKHPPEGNTWNMDPTAFQFLFVGHNYQRKGLDRLLTALSLIRNEHFQLILLGKEKNLPWFHHLVDKLGLGNKVFFLGAQKDTIPFYQVADCIVIPSLYDPFANVTVEALAMGVFVISSRFNGGSEVLNPQNGAVIEDLDDPVPFANTLKKALSRRKTPLSAQQIRNSVQHLDFSNQLRLITESSTT